MEPLGYIVRNERMMPWLAREIGRWPGRDRPQPLRYVWDSQVLNELILRWIVSCVHRPGDRDSVTAGFAELRAAFEQEKRYVDEIREIVELLLLLRLFVAHEKFLIALGQLCLDAQV